MEGAIPVTGAAGRVIGVGRTLTELCERHLRHIDQSLHAVMLGHNRRTHGREHAEIRQEECDDIHRFGQSGLNGCAFKKT